MCCAHPIRVRATETGMRPPYGRSRYFSKSLPPAPTAPSDPTSHHQAVHTTYKRITHDAQPHKRRPCAGVVHSDAWGLRSLFQ
jgi:hypothetical protein